MSGPDLPRPVPGSNGIGEFEIGVSAIGTIPPFDVWETIISQYANSPQLTALLETCFAYLDQTRDFEAFFNLIKNVDTAVGYGLDVWGRIVGVSRIIQVVDNSYFGFKEAIPGDDTFGAASFYNGQGLTSNFQLSDQAYRQLILAKAFANICDGSIPSINSMLMTLFPHRGNAYVTEGSPDVPYFGFTESTTAWGFNQACFYSGQTIETMIMTYTFEFVLSPVELAIVTTSGVLPKPTGVKASVVQTPR